MTLRVVLRKINRGIILAVLLVIGLSIYLTIDNARFSSEKAAIQSFLEDYAKAAAQINVLPKEAQKPGQQPSEEAVQKHLDEGKKVLTRYLTSVSDYNSAWDNAIRDITSAAFQNAERCAYVTDCSIEIKTVKNITKNGPSHALADFAIHVKLKTIGSPIYFFMCSIDDLQWQREGNPDIDRGSTEIDTSTYTYDFDFILSNIQLVKEKGQWKIAKFGGYSYEGDPGRMVLY